MNPLKRRVAVGLFGVALLAAACGGGSGTASGGNQAKAPARGFHSAQPRLSPKGVHGPTIQTPRVADEPVSGSGTDADPYVSFCDPTPDPDGNCVVSSFTPHYLDGATGENTDAYECPVNAPYLVNKDYAPFGTTLFRGIENREDSSPWSIGIVITKNALLGPPNQNGYRWGIGAGTDDVLTHAYNWAFDGHTYQIVLHCTADRTRGWSVTP